MAEVSPELRKQEWKRFRRLIRRFYFYCGLCQGTADPAKGTSHPDKLARGSGTVDPEKGTTHPSP